eukprot:5237341-Prymnesium_polylepis.1
MKSRSSAVRPKATPRPHQALRAPPPRGGPGWLCSSWYARAVCASRAPPNWLRGGAQTCALARLWRAPAGDSCSTARRAAPGPRPCVRGVEPKAAPDHRSEQRQVPRWAVRAR